MDTISAPTGPQSNAPQQRPPSFWESNKLLIKGFVIGILILIMLIPAAIISDLVRERANRQQEVVNEVSRKWAEPQTIVGPVLMLPYKTMEKDSKGVVTETKSIAYFLPDKLNIKGSILPETRHRSIYEVMLYRSDLTFTGNFDNLNLASLNIKPEQVIWNEARLAVGIQDTRGLDDETNFTWNNGNQKLEPGVPDNNIVATGISNLVNVDAAGSNQFSIKLKLKGSEYFYVTPVGKTTLVNISSPWSNPAFDGKYLPDTNADVTQQGFNATWKIQQASRPYPQSWVSGTHRLAESAFGVRLIQPTDNYAKTERSVKYALLFIGLTFAVFFFIELLQKKQIHPLQYLLVGIALSVFYTLLLSFSEYIGFNKAYVIAAAATIALIGLYVWSMFHKAKIAIGFTLALGSLYAYIFFLIQLQDYALLFGSIGLFVVVALAMYSSRKIDWYHINTRTPSGSK